MREAPSAFRNPISWRRSATVTSMMFIIPMPPTISEIAAMPVKTIFIARRKLRICSTIRWREETSKAFSLPVRLVSTDLTLSSTCAIDPESYTFKSIASAIRRENSLVSTLRGISTCAAEEKLKSSFSLSTAATRTTIGKTLFRPIGT